MDPASCHDHLGPSARPGGAFCALLCMAVITMVVVTGCGDSSQTAGAGVTTPAQQQPHRSVSPGARRGSPGNGGHHGRGRREPSRSTSRQLFSSKASAACQANRSVTPASHPGRQQRTQRGLVRATTLARTINILLSLRPPPPLRSQVARLLTDVERLRQLQASAAAEPTTAAPGAGLRPQIHAAERNAAQAAAAAGLIACFPASSPGTHPFVPSKTP
jgi:hypothetical protein